MLRAVRTAFHGPLAEQWARVADAPHLWRKLPFLLLLASLLVFGFFPRLLTDKIAPSVRQQVLAPYLGAAGSALRSLPPRPLSAPAQPLAVIQSEPLSRP